MTGLANFGDVGGRAAIARCVFRRPVARLVAHRDLQGHRRTGPFRMGLDDAGFALAACDRRAMDRSVRGAFTL